MSKFCLSLKTLADVTVTSAGTAVQLSSTPIFCVSVSIQTSSANAGNVFIGDSTVASAKPGYILAADKTYTIAAPDNGPEIDLSTIYVDAANDDDKVHVNYLARAKK